MTESERLDAGDTARRDGRWEQARALYAEALGGDAGAPMNAADQGRAHLGLAQCAWWLGDPATAIREATTAYARCRQAGELDRAVECAVWIATTYKADFDNHLVASGWLAKADRLLESTARGPLHGWVQVARAYQMPDLARAEALTRSAWLEARESADADLAIASLSQLGLIRVARGQVAPGMALLDEAVTTAFAEEARNLDSVVYACCDLLRACDLADDVARAATWCAAADDFVARYGCPFLYAECRICYGSVLAATGEWAAADKELRAGLEIARVASPRLHALAAARLAGLRVGQGRLEDAAALLRSTDDEGLAAVDHALATAALLLARGEGADSARVLERRLERMGGQSGRALELLVEARLADGDVGAAGEAAAALQAQAGQTGELGGADAARSAVAQAHLARHHGDDTNAEAGLRDALEMWTRLGRPFEAARTRLELAELVATRDPAEAVELACRARDALTAMGAADADRAAEFLRGHAGPARTGPRVGASSRLTQRERQVLRLLGAGLTNVEIGQRLHISRRTAAHHVSHILDKLGVRNRSEAAAWAGARGDALDA